MTLEKLMQDNLEALKNGDTSKRAILSMVISTIQSAAINALIRDNVTEEFVDQQLTKYMKSLEETKNATPADRISELAKIETEIAVVKEYAPTLITDPEKIKEILDGIGMTYVPKNRGAIMKAVSSWWRGKVDMKVVSSVLNDLMR